MNLVVMKTNWVPFNDILDIDRKFWLSTCLFMVTYLIK